MMLLHTNKIMKLVIFDGNEYNLTIPVLLLISYQRRIAKNGYMYENFFHIFSCLED